MIELKYEHDYLKETADLVAVATGMEVIIADNTGLVIADSQHDEDYEILSDGAILRACMMDGRKRIYTDSKKENPACLKCIYADSCGINAIISMPIKSGSEMIGGIGLYSYDKESQDMLLRKMDSLIEFVERILDMLLSKIEEKAARIELETAKEQQRLIIQTLDEAIIGFDEKDNIIHRNPKFDIMFDTKNDTLVNIDDVTALFRNEKLIEFIGDAFHERVSTKEAFAVGNEEIIIIYKPVIVENRYRGSLLYFRKGSDVYKDVRAIKNNYYNITFNDITCRSEALIQLKKDAERFAKGPSNILIHGKSGTGKEMFARAIHNASFVCEGPFVAVNCAAIPENLIESELFGHKEGAFTGSMKGGKIGKFQQANGGTLFLDEIGEMPLHLQPKLLRALQEKRIQPIGSNEYKAVNIRIIAATNRDLKKMVDEGTFREDLYYRLNVIPLHIPDLNSRKEDIQALMDVFLIKFNSVLDKNIVNFDRETRELLLNYEWPGNIRELQNVVEYAVNACNGKFIVRENLPQSTFDTRENITIGEIRPIREIEEIYIREALKVYGTSSEGKSKAAKALGMGRSTFYRKLAEMGEEDKKPKNLDIYSK